MEIKPGKLIPVDFGEMNSDFPIVADNKRPLSAACQSKTITILKNGDNKRCCCCICC